MNHKLFSIIIPTCNRTDLLAKCLQSLDPVTQCFPSHLYEIIVTDDGSDDSSEKLIINQFQSIKWVKGTSSGPASNRNNGAKNATGDWIIFIDDDCIPTNSLLVSYDKAIKSNQSKVYEGSIEADREKKRFNEESPVNLEGGNLWSCNFCIEKNLFFKINGFDDKFPYPAMEDIDFRVRVEKVAKIIFIEKAKVIHPWRMVKPFTSYKKWLRSNKYYLEKHCISLDNSFRVQRVKILIGSLYSYTIEIYKFSFKGVGYYIEKIYFNLLMVFI